MYSKMLGTPLKVTEPLNLVIQGYPPLSGETLNPLASPPPSSDLQALAGKFEYKPLSPKP